MRMPSAAGDYILRWYNLSDRKIVVEKALKLVEEQISINAPDEISTGTELDLSWDAPKTAEAKINLERDHFVLNIPDTVRSCRAVAPRCR